MAGQDDLDRDALIRRRKAEARVAAKRLVREHKLPMKVVGVDHVPATNRTTIYFSAPHRVDFRALVRDLGATLSCRVELRQLSPRDEARVQGGIGSCGRDLCCATFLKDFEPVSIRMAKDQDLPLNPLRISGACGRLLCCLKYEHPLYVKAQDTAPARGSEVDTPEGPGRVVDVNVPSETVKVRLKRQRPDLLLLVRLGLCAPARPTTSGTRLRPIVIPIKVDERCIVRTNVDLVEAAVRKVRRISMPSPTPAWTPGGFGRSGTVVPGLVPRK